jgi:hypothetical protein
MRAHPELISEKHRKFTLDPNATFIKQTPNESKVKMKINSPEEAAANKRAKAKAKRQRQKAKRKVKHHPLITMMALALA